MFCMFPARRNSQNNSRRKSSVGPNPSSSDCHHGGPESRGSALTTTFFCSRSCESASVSAKAGISVRKRVVGLESWYACGFANVP
jgi:hypothetical protein